MEKKNIKVILQEESEINELVFKLNTDIKINLDSEDQQSLRTLFYELIKISFDYELNLVLEIADNYGNMLYQEISQEYIKQLNIELQKISTDNPIFQT